MKSTHSYRVRNPSLWLLFICLNLPLLINLGTFRPYSPLNTSTLGNRRMPLIPVDTSITKNVPWQCCTGSTDEPTPMEHTLAVYGISPIFGYGENLSPPSTGEVPVSSLDFHAFDTFLWVIFFRHTSFQNIRTEWVPSSPILQEFLTLFRSPLSSAPRLFSIPPWFSTFTFSPSCFASALLHKFSYQNNQHPSEAYGLLAVPSLITTSAPMETSSLMFAVRKGGMVTIKITIQNGIYKNFLPLDFPPNNNALSTEQLSVEEENISTTRSENLIQGVESAPPIHTTNPSFISDPPKPSLFRLLLGHPYVENSNLYFWNEMIYSFIFLMKGASIKEYRNDFENRISLAHFKAMLPSDTFTQAQSSENDLHFVCKKCQRTVGRVGVHKPAASKVLNSYFAAYKRFPITSLNMGVAFNVSSFSSLTVLLVNPDKLPLRVHGSVNIMNAGHDALSYEQQALPTTFLLLFGLYVIGTFYMGILVLQYKEKRTTLHIMSLFNIVLCCTVLAGSWYAPQIGKKVQEVVFIFLLLLAALGFKIIRRSLTNVEIRLLTLFFSGLFFLNVFVVFLPRLETFRAIVLWVIILVAFIVLTVTLHSLRSSIQESGLSIYTGLLYTKYEATARLIPILVWVFLRSYVLWFYKLSLLPLIFKGESYISWDEWVFVMVENIADFILYMLVFYILKPALPMRIFKEHVLRNNEEGMDEDDIPFFVEEH
ncbi:hypothetical protein IE077_001159 [Cardiosporidium cionae]|uniref:Uncharacterized protein n=1 Tax=Cardiosporidium cionae TaxID=476202 RepID=A0ABQ7JDI1_9APIC|nr:hypothetical protein IE077_001159 [Cardiosporidium cionae]|eukprot:KAF8822058.1 hypothetical protein IE077_001159 [Cardiosporidium cionae]